VLVGSLAVPQAFGAHALEFSLAYLAVRIIHIAVYIRASHDGDIGAAVKRLAPGLLSACGLLILASAFDGWPQAALWAAAVALDYGTPAITGVRGFRVEPKHFAERHGLILIIALGESIVAVGVGTGFDLSARAIAIAVLGLVVASSLWWAYFDVVAIVAARALAEARGVERARLARDSYSYLHLPMIAGVELLAVGLREALHQVDSPLPAVVSFMLCGGVALYLLGHIAFRLRNRGTVNRQRLVVAGICLALIPVGTHAHALVTLACLAAVCAGLIAYEAIRFREARARVRTTGAT
jgi:low temperature requirement protein LtrA